MTFLPSLLHSDLTRELSRHGDRAAPGRRLVRPARPVVDRPRRAR